MVDYFAGCLLGLATGDALGAPHEGGMLERLLWCVIGRTRGGDLRWTDDTQMAIDLAESLLEHGEVRQDELARRFAASYRWSRGYGPGVARVLKRIRRGEDWQRASRAVYLGGSYGNGAAMRAPVLALFYSGNRAELERAARASAEVTHAHPLGIEGAMLIAAAAHALTQGTVVDSVLDVVQEVCSAPEFGERLKVVRSWLDTGATPTPREIADRLGNGVTAPASCPTALYIALRHLRLSFEEMMRFVIRCRGDVDTIGAMAGALWGITNGPAKIPAARLERRDEIVQLATRIRQGHAPASGSA